MTASRVTIEETRLADDAARRANWKRWGPYLAERQWGTVREDYSATGECWTYFPHDQSRSRAYRWGEDGLLGFTDRECRLCFSVALWNGRDPILKERLYGLTGPEGNHGEDVKECYYYLDATPTHSYMTALYKYPQAEYPYHRLMEENARRGRQDREFELADTGVFEGNRYFDVLAEYAKAGPDDILITIQVSNRGPEPAPISVLPTIWFRNTWSWGRTGEGYWEKPEISLGKDGALLARHVTLGSFTLAAGKSDDGAAPEPLFTDNETNVQRLFGTPNPAPYVKDAFHEYVVHGRKEAVTPERRGTKAALLYRLVVPPGGTATLRLRLTEAGSAGGRAATASIEPASFDRVVAQRRAESDAFHATRLPDTLSAEEKRVARQAYAGLLWSKQYFYYVVREWLEGDPAQPPPPQERSRGRNSDWQHLFNRDVVSMPDKWEYPWYAAWDLAFHMIPFATLDPQFAKEQLVLFLREWYMHPNGQIPAYEFAFGDVNPPVHAWACWRTYKMTAPRGGRDREFLSRCFQKLVINFTWWVNRKDEEGKHLFSGGFLGLDNIGVFDRGKPLPTGGHLEQADGTAWMAFYAGTMLAMALELSRDNHATEDMASKFFEHYVAIADAMNNLGGMGLWDEQDGFYYDQLHMDGKSHPIKVRSLVGLIPLLAVGVLEMEHIGSLPGFKKRLDWFLKNRVDLAQQISRIVTRQGGHEHLLLAVTSRERLVRVLRYMLDENEFLSPYGIRSLSRVHEKHPFIVAIDGMESRVDYTPGESNTGLFGGNSNWRGPIWLPVNYLLIEALERYHHFYGEGLQVECPVGSGRMMDLQEVADELRRRLVSIFLPDGRGRRPCHGDEERYARDSNFKDLVLFYECFHADTGRGVGASHQTGWTALAGRLVQELGKTR
jgi:Mannosylglycerate hydrolase MGH1-like glycoside hydrolase domain